MITTAATIRSATTGIPETGIAMIAIGRWNGAEIGTGTGDTMTVMEETDAIVVVIPLRLKVSRHATHHLYIALTTLQTNLERGDRDGVTSRQRWTSRVCRLL